MKTTACSPPPYLRKPSFGYFSSNSLINSNSLWLHTSNPCRPLLRLCSTSDMRLTRCLPTGSGPPSPPQVDPPRSTGITGVASKFKDHVQIFFAVLFWMSLFFWASASGGNNSRSKR